jgi:Putative Actinobacterial Holin-X, holin superfamily III
VSDVSDTSDEVAGSDWPAQAAGAIEQAVQVVREKTVVPAQKATKVVVYGLLTTFFVLTAVTLLIIGLFRGLVILTGEVWIAYLICGGILILVGAFCWMLRFKAPSDDDPEEPSS